MKGMSELKIEKLAEAVPGAVFYEGEKLFEEGAVSNVVSSTNIVTAKVQGSKRYHTVIKFLDNGNISFSCSCPYDRGVCKHSIALALAVSNDSDILNKVGNESEGEIKITAILLMETFLYGAKNKFFDKVSRKKISKMHL